MNRIAIVLLLAVAAFPAAAQQPKANIGYIGAADFTPLFVAKDKGFFEKRGFVAQQRNSVSIGDEWLANTTLSKQLGGA